MSELKNKKWVIRGEIFITIWGYSDVDGCVIRAITPGGGTMLQATLATWLTVM